MGVMIFWKDEVILDSSGSIVESLCEYLVSIIFESEEILLSEDFENFKTRLLGGISPGVGFNIANYIHTKEDITLLIKLTRKAIDRFYEEFPSLPQCIIDDLENFYNNLLKIQKSLSSNTSNKK